jgi:hypothetical protein
MLRWTQRETASMDLLSVGFVLDSVFRFVDASVTRGGEVINDNTPHTDHAMYERETQCPAQCG